MIAIRLHTDTESRLECRAKKTGRTKTFHAREAILEHVDHSEDIYLASRRLESPPKIYSAEKVKHELNL